MDANANRTSNGAYHVRQLAHRRLPAVEKKDDAKKSMLGAKQKEWFKQELLDSNGKYPLICWISPVHSTRIDFRSPPARNV